jgi:DNA polymerase-3 subunit delta'
LLKLIEEPPPDTLFIMVAENQSLILPTLLSRLQLIKIPLLPQRDIEAALELRESVPVQKAEQIAAISDGNYHEALQILQHADDDWEQWLRTWLNDVVKGNRESQLKWIEEISKTGREKQKQFLKYFTHLIDLAIRVRMSGESGPSYAANQQSSDFALRLNKLLDSAQLEALAHEMNNAAYYIERNANAKILFHALTIKLYHIITNKSVILIP